MFDLATTKFDQVLDHKIRCELDASTSYTLQADGTRSNDATFRATHTVSTGADAISGLVVLDQLSIPRDTVDELFTGYVTGALLTDLDLPSGVEALVLGTRLKLAEANWDNLVDPNARYDVISERVSYRSNSPDGAPDTTLTGLIVRPDVTTAERFIARDTALVLSHATGSTPSDLNPSDAWFILANQFAARGYLVIAADNYGRGGTGDNPETYLLANRTADNSIDLIEQVLADPKYDGAHDGTALTIAGYSQGGHSAFGLWLAYKHRATQTSLLIASMRAALPTISTRHFAVFSSIWTAHVMILTTADSSTRTPRYRLQRIEFCPDYSPTLTQS